MNEVYESPKYVQTSLAGAIGLGLEQGKFLRGVKCTCLNLLLTYKNGCRGACSYCGLARGRDQGEDPTFIRVKWPTYPLEEILSRTKNKKHAFKRACVSMITHNRALEDTCTIIQQVRQGTGLPVSGLLAPTAMKGKGDLEAVKAAGADRVGIAIDAATQELFEKHRGREVNGPHRWERFWQGVDDAVEVFGRYQVGVHLIVGLGETEQEMTGIISRAYRMGALTHLFSFFPEAGTRLERYPQPPLGQYRRVQLVRHLINEGVITGESVGYSPRGEIVDFGVNIEKYLKDGMVFMTSGCPGEDGLVACNRPFGNERASEPMRNYPFLPSDDDKEVIRSQVWA